MAEEQRVEAERLAQEREAEQKVINEAPILTVPCITNALNNTPGIVPQPVVIDLVPPMAAPTARALKWITQLTGGSFNHSHPFVAQPAPRTHQQGTAPM